jgi:ATP-dependent Clp protease ATP-binding subunit ClpB
MDAAPRKDELDYKVDRSGGLVNAVTGLKSDILIQVPSSAARGEAAQAVKKMRIMEEGMDEELISARAGRGAPACAMSDK